MQYLKVILFAIVASGLVSFNEGNDTFFEKPFGFEPNISNFKNSDNPEFKKKIFVIKRYPSDTIYKFIYKKSYILINKSRNGETYIGGIVKDKKFPLHKDIELGMSKKDLKLKFHQNLKQNNDTLSLYNKNYGNSYDFIFKNDKLEYLRINNK